jgi:DNA-binding SARP family transcriptional activator
MVARPANPRLTLRGRDQWAVNSAVNFSFPIEFPMLFSLRLLGGAAIERGGGPVTGRAAHKRRIAILALLACARGRLLGRDKLIGYLWAEHPTEAARHLLSESLYVLRKELGEDAFVIAGDEVGLNGDETGSDLREFEAAVERNDLAAAVALYSGAFLDGFYVSDAPAFERWADEERSRLQRTYARSLERLAEAAEAAGEMLQACEWWRRLTSEDPYSSRVAIRLMRTLDAAGERAASLRHATAHAALLRAEFGSDPDPDVEAFAARLREAPPQAAQPRPEPLPRIGLFPPPPPVPPATEEGDAAPTRAAELVAARPRARRRALWGTVSLGVVVVMLGGIRARARTSVAAVDAAQYVVLPFGVQGRAARGSLTPHVSSVLMHDELGHWNDVRLIDSQRAHDVVARRGAPRTLTDAKHMARELGAGKLVWGELTLLGDSVMVEAGVYDVRRHDRAVAWKSVRVAPDLSDAPAKFAELARELMGAAPDDGGGGETASLAAARAYQEGRAALAGWDLRRARAALERAVSLDPGYAHAHFWLAQVLSWSGAEPAEWKDHAARATAGTQALSAPDRSRAGALLALAEGRHPDACRTYAALLVRDTTDFAAWYGTGECNARDPRVVRDARSPTGWSFRGSYARAVDAYGRALRLVPSAFLAFRRAGFARLNELLITDARGVRMGYALTRDTVGFAAYPSLQADTVAYVPYPFEQFQSLAQTSVPGTRAEAVRHNRKVLLSVVSSWARAFPRSAEAREAHALGLEAVGSIAAARQGEPSAASELAAARRLAEGGDARIGLGVAQVRLWLKQREFPRAKALADSVLAGAAAAGSHDAQRLAPLAALTGRAALAAELLRRSASDGIPVAGRPGDIPVPVLEEDAELLVYDALGMSAEAAEAERRVERAIHIWIEPARREEARTALLSIPRRLAGARGVAAASRAPLRTTDRLLEMQQALAVGDREAVAAGMQRLRQLRADRRPGDATLDAVVAEAQLLLTAGDTTGASEGLDASLEALATLSPELLDRVPEAASVPRAMLLRVETALSRGDDRAVRHWVDALSILWADADRPLKERVRRLRSTIPRVTTP